MRYDIYIYIYVIRRLRVNYIYEFVHANKYQMGHAVAQLVEALRYKPEGSGFDSCWFHWNI